MNIAQQQKIDTRTLNEAASSAVSRFLTAADKTGEGERTWHVAPYAPFVVANYGSTASLGHMLKFGDELVWECVNVAMRDGQFWLRFVQMPHGVDWGADHGNLDFANAFLTEMANRYLGAES